MVWKVTSLCVGPLSLLSLGDLVFGSNTTISFDSTTNSPAFQVTSCANFNGQLNVVVDPKAIDPSGGTSFPLAAYDCKAGGFTSVSAGSDGCVEAEAVYGPTQTAILLHLAAKCKSQGSGVLPSLLSLGSLLGLAMMYQL